MNPFVISELLTGVSAFVFGLFVYLRDPSRKLNRLWFLFSISVSLWGFTGMAAVTAQDPLLSLWIWRLALFSSVLWIPVLYLHFTYEFCGIGKRGFLVVTYGIACSFMPFMWTEHYFKDTRLLFGQLQYAVAGPFMYHVFYAWWVVTYSYSFYLLIRTYAASDRHKKLQIGYMFTAIVIGAAGGSMNFFPFFGIEIYPWGNFATSLYLLLISYAIVKHQLLDIRVVIKKAIIYSLFVFLVSIVYFALVYVCYRFLIAPMSSVRTVEWSIVSVLAIAVFFKPLEMISQRFLERRVFKGTIGEISAQKEKLQEELERRERLKSVGILAAGMAHEIKNPLTAIKTFADYLPVRYGDAEFREKFGRIVSREVGRIQNIIRDLLVFSKPAEPDRKRCALGRILRDELELLTNEFLKRKIEIVFDGADAEVFVDPEQMKQVFLNLIMNAADAMAAGGGSLTIRVMQRGHSVEVSLRDTGCGIAKERIRHIFDPFYTDKEEGTGLGLAISHSIVEKNGGRIEVASELGKGTLITVSLPRP
jgi:signal transduction histidine kinase